MRPRTRTAGSPSAASATTPSNSTSVPTSVSSWRVALCQATKAASMLRCRSSSLAAYQGASNGKAAQRFSNSATSRASLVAESATSACTTDPRVEFSARAPVPPCFSASQRSGQSDSVCSVEGLRLTR